MSYWKIIIFGLSVLAAASFAGPPQPPQKCFEDSEVILDAGVVDAITADVDGDGHEDLLAHQPPNLVILRNDGENFVPYASIEVGAAATKLAAGFINDDAAPDLGILRGDELVIYINTGNGYPAQPTNVIPTAAGPVHLLFADLDNDGDDDVVTTHTALGQVNAILLTPAGELQNSSTILKLPGVKKTAAGNLNGDALPDLAVQAGRAWVLLNRGGGDYHAQLIDLPASGDNVVLSLTAANVANDESDEVIVLFRNLDIAFDASFKWFYIVSVGDDEALKCDLQPMDLYGIDPTAVAATDQDDDGDPDLWVGCEDGSGVPVYYYENVAGTLTRKTAADGFDAPASILPVSIKSHRNLLVRQDDSVRMLRSEDSSIMRTLHYQFISESSTAIRLRTGDLNGDGPDEVVFFTAEGVFVDWGGARGPVELELVIPGRYTGGFVIDLNRDGRLDVCTTSYIEDVSSIFLQQANGSFLLAAEIENERIESFGDVNGDGLIDAAASGFCTVYLQSPDGAFMESPVGCSESCAFGTLLADMNGDGFDDLVHSGEVCLSDGHGISAASIPYDTSFTTFPYPEAVGDIDNDGDMDFVFQNETVDHHAGYYIYTNDGFGALTRVSYPAGFGPETCVGVSLSLVDVDGDGVRDFVNGTFWEGGLFYYHGNGDGTIAGIQGWHCGYGGGLNLAVGDFDGDGALDLACVGADDSFWSDSQFFARAYGTCIVNCREDTNYDNRVDVFDLFELLNDWGPCPSCFSDLDRDGVVGRGDLDRLLAAWGACE